MRIAMGLEYDGTHYQGFQSQPGLVTIQSALESALSQVADTKVAITCAGRTDAGVHAALQVIHFDTDAERSEYAWILGTNANLPNDIAIKWVKIVPESFHARFEARRRAYRYTLCNSRYRSPLSHRFSGWYRKPLDAELMHEAAQYLVGEHDFSSFRAAGCQSKSPVRTIHRCDVRREGEQIILEIEANAFLYNMVRNIMGSLMAVGEGKFPPEWLKMALDAKDRCQAGVKAPPNGLSLIEITYPSVYNLPSAFERASYELV